MRTDVKKPTAPPPETPPSPAVGSPEPEPEAEVVDAATQAKIDEDIKDQAYADGYEAGIEAEKLEVRQYTSKSTRRRANAMLLDSLRAFIVNNPLDDEDFSTRKSPRDATQRQVDRAIAAVLGEVMGMAKEETPLPPKSASTPASPPAPEGV